MTAALGSVARRLLFLLGQRSVVAGIPVVFLSDSDDAPAAFERLRAAVDLIATHDPPRLLLIGRIRSIIIGGLGNTPTAFYSRAARACVFALPYVDARAVSLTWLASGLVHEATHARIHAMGARFAQARRARIERLCLREQMAFLQRVPNADVEIAHLQALITALDAPTA